eukprot:CAMPEP_0194340504 /NCGR_PEP_ID=MMETSP0171-20130528/86589_1 /TAXON_ID=218684 /ORGANISM="Corethron pennatum, Strain L29A3" /LENGTH=356 /DNA_ID=CAMNT_0039105479 /DNA_START=120 /DNA_END=1187 /DNA_ORIENTATION=+
MEKLSLKDLSIGSIGTHLSMSSVREKRGSVVTLLNDSLNVVENVITQVVDVATQNTSKISRVIASSLSQTIPTKKILSSDNYKIQMPVTFNAEADSPSLMGKVFGKAKRKRTIEVEVQLRWIPPLSEEEKDVPQISKLPKSSIVKIPQFESTGNTSNYVSLSGETVLRGVGNPRTDNIFTVIESQYENDPLGPRTISSEEAPPVKRVYVVYGINVPTDVGYAVCRPRAFVQKKGRLKPKFILDTSAKIASDDIDQSCGYTTSGGRIQETQYTPQKNWSTGATDCCSGDGTVPYWSLSVPQKWSSPTCDVRIKEIEGSGAYHITMLDDPRFHRALLDYLGGQNIIKKYEEQAYKVIR